MSLWLRAGALAGGAAAAYMGTRKNDNREGEADPKTPTSALTEQAKKYVPTENKSQRQMLNELDKGN
jgi:ribosomal protein L13